MSLFVVATTFHNFNPKDIKNFGFTPEYIDIADTSIKTGGYNSHLLYSDEYFNNGKNPQNQIIENTQREPLYPTLLITLKTLGMDEAAVVYIQIYCLLICFLVWEYFIYRRLGKAVSIFFILLMFFTPVFSFYTSVMYPYIFQLLLITLGIVFIGYAAESRRVFMFGLSGVMFGLSCYERGTYLILPIFISLALVIYRRKYRVDVRSIFLFLILSYTVVIPWLMRNLTLGTLGMNQLSGYTLGYTYGGLKSHSISTAQQNYDKNVKKFGTDAGTIGYINYQVLATGRSYSEVDKEVTSIIVDKIIYNYKDVINIISSNIIRYPSDLGNFIYSNLFFHNPTDTYINVVSGNLPSVIDYLIFLLAICGIFLQVKRGLILGYISVSILIYNLLFSTLIVLFDPRYRGVTDIVLYTAMIYFIVTLMHGYIYKFYSRFKKAYL